MLNNLKASTKITTFIILFPLITLLMYGGLSHLFFFYAKYNDEKQELARYEKILMDGEKSRLIEKVENLARFIRYYNYKSNNKIKKELKSIIYTSAHIANNLYHKYKNIMDKKDLQLLIKNTLSNVDFDDGIGYLFLLDMKGNSIVHPNKNIVGTNILNLRDVNGKYIIKEFMSVLEENKEGFVDYYWNIPNKVKNDLQYKISFVKMLDMYNWYIGAGEYLKYMTKFVSNEMLDYITKNSQFKYGYFFISNSNNEIIFHPYIKQIEDINKFRMEAIYEDEKQIAFTTYVAEYDWYITAIKELRSIRKNINEHKKENKKKIEEDIKTNMYLMILTWFISLLFSLYLSFIVNKMLKKYENRLNDSNSKLIFQSRQALIGELFSMIAHQWRQPINKIASILVVLRFNLHKKELYSKELDKKYQDIENSIEFMSETIDDFRTFYQPKHSKEYTDISILIEKALYFVRDSINKKNIKITKKLLNIECKIYANEFLQVIINLITNAIDAVLQDGIVQIEMYKKDNTISILVKDNGKGMSSKQLSRIFDPYYTTKNNSMGLGLYMSKMIIEKHFSGDINVTSSISKGSIFKINLYRQS